MNFQAPKIFRNLTRSATISISLAGVVVCSIGLSAEGRGDGDRHERRGPPPIAFEACAAAQLDDACEVVTPRGETLGGQCVVPRRRHRSGEVDQQGVDSDTDSEILVCRPERHNPRMQSELT